jgi:tRNA A-37 threonylcarbamoyl transferase component Bud32
MMGPGIDLPLVDAAGVPIADGSMTLIDEVRGPKRDGCSVARVRLDRTLLALKHHRLFRWKQRIPATLGRSRLANERRMLLRARSAGLPVAELIAVGQRRRWGLVVEQVLLVRWMEHHVTMTQRIRDAAEQGRRAALRKAGPALAELLAQMRRASIADRDFGPHNLLVDEKTADFAAPVWIDLEAAYEAGPDDRGDTLLTLAGTLASWWYCCREDQAELQAVFDAVCRALPEPPGGWRALLEPLNKIVLHRSRKQLRVGSIQTVPEPVRLTSNG